MSKRSLRKIKPRRISVNGRDYVTSTQNAQFPSTFSNFLRFKIMSAHNF